MHLQAASERGSTQNQNSTLSLNLTYDDTMPHRDPSMADMMTNLRPERYGSDVIGLIACFAHWGKLSPFPLGTRDSYILIAQLKVSSQLRATWKKKNSLSFICMVDMCRGGSVQTITSHIRQIKPCRLRRVLYQNKSASTLNGKQEVYKRVEGIFESSCMFSGCGTVSAC